MTLRDKLKAEVALVLGVGAAVGEAFVQTQPTGKAHDVLVIALPVVAALGIRSNVSPVSKVLGSFPAVLAVSTKLEAVVRQLANLAPVYAAKPDTTDSAPAVTETPAAVPASIGQHLGQISPSA